MQVKEIMKKKVRSVLPDTNAFESLELLRKEKISGLPVIDAHNKLVGMFTEKEVLAKILPSYLEQVGNFVYQNNPKAVKQRIISLSHSKVSDLARSEVVTVEEDTGLCEVAHIMLTNKVRRVPVLNKIKEVVGIVSRGDVMAALIDEYAKE